MHRNPQSIAGALTLAITLIWCLAAGRLNYFTGDYAIVFHPLILYLLPYACILLVAFAIGCVMRKWRFATLAIISLAAVVALFFLGYRIELYAWERSLLRYSKVNQEAIHNAAAIPDFTENFLPIWSDEDLVVLEGFQWYCEHHLASPSGTFLAFRYRGTVHVRIQKIRNGYRGVAFVESPRSLENLLTDQFRMVYEERGPIDGHWVIWRTVVD